MIKVLVVDDSALARKLLGQVLGSEPDVTVEFARGGMEALDKISTFDPGVVTLDVHMPDMDGLACLDRIMVEWPRPVVMVSSVTAEGADATFEALRRGAVDFVAKPSGTVSLRIHEMAPELIRKVRAAAGAKLRSSLRLKERVRHRIGTSALDDQTAGAVLRWDAVDKGPSTDATKLSARQTVRRLPAASGDGVVVVGTSTGGPPALEALLTALPANFPWPIVVAQHMPASFTGALAGRLHRLCMLEVVEVQRSLELRPACVYIGRGGADIIITKRGGVLSAAAAPADPDYLWHPSADRLVRSAMAHIPPTQIVGVLMTGMGNDGAQAMALLNAMGGRTIAEAQETAVVWGMPGELVRLGGADFVVPVQTIARTLLRLVPACL